VSWTSGFGTIQNVLASVCWVKRISQLVAAGIPTYRGERLQQAEHEL
jgi:hypothetical protein